MKNVTSTRASKTRQVLISLATCAVATFLLYRCFRQVDLGLFRRELFQVNPVFLAAGVLFLGGIIFLNAAQWWVFLPPARRVPITRLAETVSMTLMTANTMPWGHTAVAYLLGREKKIGHAVALSVWTADQMMGGVAKVLFYVAIAWLVPLPDLLRHAIRAFVALNILVYAVLLLIGFWHRRRRETAPGEGWRWWKKLSRFALEWAQHLDTLRDARSIFWGVLCALGMKSCEAAAIYLIQRGFGLDLPLSASWVLVVALNLATMFPIAPGNLGVYEAAAFYLYKFWGVDPTQAMTLAVFHHMVYLIPMVVPGYILMIRRGVKIRPDPPPDPSWAEII